MMNLKRYLVSSYITPVLHGKRGIRRLFLKASDLYILVFSIYLATAIRFDSFVPLSFLTDNVWQILGLILFQHAVFNLSGLYKPVIRYSGLTFLNLAGRAVLVSTVGLLGLNHFAENWALPRSILIIQALLALILVVSLRLSLRWLVRKSVMSQKRQLQLCQIPTRLLIYGAGAAGVELLQALSNSPQYRVVGFVDDNPDIQKNANIEGLKVHASESIDVLLSKGYFDAIVLAMPSVAPSVRRRIFERIQRLSIPVKTVPSLNSILSGEITIKEIRDVDVVDLLGREEIKADPVLLRKHIKDQVVLVTGAGGSIGSELCRQVARQQPTCLILYELNEFALYSIHQELTEAHKDLKVLPILGNVADKAYFCQVLDQYHVQTIYHAAAYKHVPLLESNIPKAIENNVLGTLSVAESSIECGVEHFVLISTDKAVRPTNIMGTTKRIAELIVQGLSHQPINRTCFAIVRFGNVLGSSGSVVPRFRQQIATGGPITLTHREITRYFMSIPEAARLVIQAGAMAKVSEVFLLDMGEPVKIYDLAVQMIRLSGLIPDEDIQIQITGLRPGEKLYEELLIAGENVKSTHHPKILCSEEYYLPWAELEPRVHQLIDLARSGHVGAVKGLIRLLVPEYKPQSSLPVTISRAG